MAQKNIEKCTKVTENIMHKKQIYLTAAKEYNINAGKENVSRGVCSLLCTSYGQACLLLYIMTADLVQHMLRSKFRLLLCCNKNVNMMMLLLLKKIISKQATTYSKMNNYLTICPNSNSKYYSEIRISLI